MDLDKHALLSLRWWPVYLRNLLVWRKLAVPSVMANIADPLITLIAFGWGLGKLMPHIEGVDYMVFLAAGSLCMSTMMAASFEALYSAFSRMHVQRTWDCLMNAPLELDDILAAEWLWAATKGVFSGVAILLVVLMLGISASFKLLLVLPVVVLLGMCFAALALCFNALATGYDFFSYYFTLVLTPMVFVSGVFYPVDGLPAWLAALAQMLPLANAIELVRPLVLDHWPVHPLRNLAVLVGYMLVCLFLARVLTRRRFAR